jgi:LysM repeat protein
MADQSFYPVMEEGYQGKKRLVLTTVRKNQNKVQIDLYKSNDKTIDPSLYVGSLVIENIEDADKGEPEIEVILGIDEHKNLNAVARNLKTGTKQRLQTSLESLEEHEIYDIPDFELEEEDGKTPVAATRAGQANKTIAGDNYPLDDEDRRKTFLKEKKDSPAGKIVLITLGLLVLVALAALVIGVATKMINLPLPNFNFLTGKKPQPTAKVVKVVPTAAPATSTPPTAKPEPTKAPSPTKMVTNQELTKAVPTQTTVKINGKNYIEYKIVWGDTLWWIANKYYGNPWMYKKIYKYEKNKLKDPDLIIAGTKLYIPKK